MKYISKFRIKLYENNEIPENSVVELINIELILNSAVVNVFDRYSKYRIPLDVFRFAFEEVEEHKNVNE